MQALAVYVVASWVVLQVVDVVADPLELPLWIPRALIIAVTIGLPIVAGLSWVFDVTRLGLVRTPPVSDADRKTIGLGTLGVLTLCVLGIGVLISRQWDVPQEDPVEETPVLSLAVFPFHVLPSVKESHLARLSDELIDRFRANPRLRVASNDAVEVLPPASDRVSRATQLGVRYVLEGTIERSGETIDVAIQLYDRNAGQETWRRSFQNAQLSVVNPLVVDALLNFLGVAQSDAPRLTTNAKAYDLYLQGLQYWSADPTQAKVEELFQDAIKQDSRFSLPYAGLCRYYVKRYHDLAAPADFQTAEKYCFRALTLDDRSAEVHRAIGAIYGSSGQVEKARDSYNKVLSMSPEHFGARLGLAGTYYRSDPILAERMLTELVRDHPGSPSGYASLQNLYFRLGRYEDAVDPGRWWVRLNPSDEAAQFSLSSDLMLAGLFSEAKTLLLGMLAKGSPRVGDIHSNLATVYFFEGDYGDAAELYRLAIEREPDNPIFVRNLGDAIWHLEGKAESRPVFEEVVRLGRLHLEINPDDFEVLSCLVVASGSLGDERQLEEFLRRGLSVASNDPQVHYDGAVAYSRIDKPEIASEHAIKARELGYPLAVLEADPDIRIVGVTLEQ